MFTLYVVAYKPKSLTQQINESMAIQQYNEEPKGPQQIS